MSVPPLDAAVSTVYPFVVFLAEFCGGALAIVVCTVALRALLLPLSLAAARGERARAALIPRVRELQRRYAKDPARLRTELAAVYASAGVSPLAGLLPALAQAPAFLVTYRLFAAPTVAGHPNVLLYHTLFGATLSAHVFSAPWAFAPLLVALAALGWLAGRRIGARGLAAVLPFATVVTAMFVPLAGAVYLVTSSAWTGTVEVWPRRRAAGGGG
jgi:YidC/Oxa1 family membrane protein insertase